MPTTQNTNQLSPEAITRLHQRTGKAVAAAILLQFPTPSQAAQPATATTTPQPTPPQQVIRLTAPPRDGEIIRYGNGRVLGTATAGTNGTFTLSPSPMSETIATRQSTSTLAEPTVAVNSSEELVRALAAIGAKGEQELNHEATLSSRIGSFKRNENARSRDGIANREKKRGAVAAEAGNVAALDSAIGAQAAEIARYCSTITDIGQRKALVEICQRPENISMLLKIPPQHATTIIEAICTKEACAAANATLAKLSEYKAIGHQNDGRSDAEKAQAEQQILLTNGRIEMEKLPRYNQELFSDAFTLGLRAGIYTTAVSLSYETTRANGTTKRHDQNTTHTWIKPQNGQVTQISIAQRPMYATH